jgi:hypothetical protein
MASPPHPPNIKVEWTHNKKIAYPPSTCVHTPPQHTHVPSDSHPFEFFKFSCRMQLWQPLPNTLPKVDELGEEGLYFTKVVYAMIWNGEWGWGGFDF